MNSVKELLQHMIERMSDTEARQLLEFAQHLRHRRDDSLTLKRLAADPAFKVPESRARGFQVVAPSTARAWQLRDSWSMIGGDLLLSGYQCMG
jgi:hypothetical protein